MSAALKGRGHNAKGRSKTGEAFVGLPHTTLRHSAWRSLSGAAVKVYLELHSRFHGKNNGELSLSLDEGARLLGLSKSTVRRAFQELEAKGFIVKTRQGYWYGRKATEWRLTSKPCNGHLATNEWRNWRPTEGPKNKTRYSSGTYSEADGAVSVPRPENMCRVSTRQSDF